MAMQTMKPNKLTAFLSRPFTSGNRVVLWTQLYWIAMELYFYEYFFVDWKFFATVMACCVAILLVYRLLHDTVCWTIIASMILWFCIFLEVYELRDSLLGPWHSLIATLLFCTLNIVVPLFSILYDRIAKRITLRNALLLYILVGSLYLVVWWIGALLVPAGRQIHVVESMVDQVRQYETPSRQQLDALLDLCDSGEYEIWTYDTDMSHIIFYPQGSYKLHERAQAFLSAYERNKTCFIRCRYRPLNGKSKYIGIIIDYNIAEKTYRVEPIVEYGVFYDKNNGG